MNITKIIALSAGLVLAATALSAQGMGPGMGGPMGGRKACGGRWQGQAFGPMARFLNLTEAQQAKAKAITEGHQATLDAKLKAADEAREAQRKAMHDPAASDAKVKELHAKAADAMGAVMLEHRAMMREFEAILTLEQKAALEKQRAGCGFGGRKGMGRGSCGGW